MRPFLLSALVSMAALGAAPVTARDDALSRDDVAWLNRVTFGVDAATVARYRELGRRRFLDEQLHPRASGLPADVNAQVAAFDLSKTSVVELMTRVRDQRR